MNNLNGTLTRYSVDVLELSPVPFQKPSRCRLPGPVHCGFTILVGLAVSALMLAAIWGTWRMLDAGEWTFAVVAGGFAAGLCFLLYLLMLGEFSSGVWFQFDRQSGEFVRLQRPFGFWRLPRPVASWKLADVETLHLIHGGVKSIRHSQTTQSGLFDTLSWTTHHHIYRLELKMKDEAESEPVVVVSTYDWAWLRKIAPPVSEFCNVPILDELCHDSQVDVGGKSIRDH
jgi:hypothetical protein